MTEKIAAQLQEAYNNKGRTAKHLIPQDASQIWVGTRTNRVRKGKHYQNNPRSPCDPNYASTG